MNTTEDDMNMDELMQHAHNFFIEDPTVTRVMRMFEMRSNEGMKHYGTSMEDNPADIIFWLRSLQEELMDAILYAERSIKELEKKDK